MKKLIVITIGLALVAMVYFSKRPWNIAPATAQVAISPQEDELKTLEEAILQVSECRKVTISKLDATQKMHFETKAQIMSKFKTFDKTKQDALIKQFQSQALSEESEKDPEIKKLYDQFRKTFKLQGHIEYLRKELTCYDEKLSQAQKQCEHLKECIDARKNLGLDLETGRPLEGAGSNALDDLIAILDENEKEINTLNVNDVLHNDRENQAIARKLFSDATKKDQEQIAEPNEQHKALVQPNVKAVNPPLPAKSNKIQTDMSKPLQKTKNATLHAGTDDKETDVSKQSIDDGKLASQDNEFGRIVEYQTDDIQVQRGPLRRCFRLIFPRLCERIDSRRNRDFIDGDSVIDTPEDATTFIIWQ